MPMPYLNVDEQRLFYTDGRGPQGAPALLLLHGAGGSHLDWPPALRRLPRARVYTVDLPGHGRSRPPGRSTIEAYADVVATLVEALGLDNLFLAGHSMGGAIAQELARRGLAALSGLALIGSGARLKVSDVLLQSARDDLQAVVSFVTRYAWAERANPALVQAARERLAQNNPAVVHGDFLACDGFDLRGQLGAVDLPTLVIAGTADRMTPLKLGRSLAEELPAAELLVLEGAGHMMTLEQPQAVAEAVAAFVERNSNQSS